MGIENIIKILMLLEHNSIVTLNQITQECKISKRQVFRYLNMLSENNISVYHDRKIGGYKLSERGQFSFTNFTVVEEVYFVSTILYFLVNYKSKSIFGEILPKIEILLKNDSRNIIHNLFNRLKTELPLEQFFDKIHYAIIDYAVEYKIPIQVWSNSESSALKITKPNLVFNERWQIKDLEKRESFVELQEINKIDFVR